VRRRKGKGGGETSQYPPEPEVIKRKGGVLNRNVREGKGEKEKKGAHAKERVPGTKGKKEGGCSRISFGGD